MGKRKNVSTEDEKIRKKIQKLEQKLLRKKKTRIILSSSDDETNGQILNDDEIEDGSRQASPQANIVPLELPPMVSPRADVPPQPNDTNTLSLDPIPGPSSAPDVEPAAVVDQVNAEEIGPEECILEDDILKILGDAPQAETALGKNVHKAIADRWQEILKNGLSKETKEKIVEKYLVPANCNFLLAPLLNLEAKAAVPETLAKRDATMLQKQNQIGIGLAALSQVMELVVSNETSKEKLLQPLSDACRLLCDSHNAETKTRRNIMLSSINVGLRDTLGDTTRDKFLFGVDVSEKLKVAKSVPKTGESLQKVIPKTLSKNTNQPRNKNHLNYKGQHRKTPNKWEAFRGRGAAPQPPPPPPAARAPTRAPAYQTYQPTSRTRSPPRRTQRR